MTEEISDRMLVGTMREVAEIFEVNTRAVQEWAKKGMPRKYFPESGNYIYDLEDIYDWKVKREGALAVTKNGKFEANIADAMPMIPEMKSRVEEFQINKADILAHEQMSTLQLQQRIRDLKLANMTDEQIEALTTREAQAWYKMLGVDFAIKFDKEQLERNKTIDGVGKVLDIITKIKEIERGQSAES